MAISLIGIVKNVLSGPLRNVTVTSVTEGWPPQVGPDGRDMRWATLNRFGDARVNPVTITYESKGKRYILDDLHEVPPAFSHRSKRDRQESFDNSGDNPHEITRYEIDTLAGLVNKEIAVRTYNPNSIWMARAIIDYSVKQDLHPSKSI